MLQEALLIRPVSSVAADGASCQMTRTELQKRLAECAFGRNQVIFDAYFRWSEGKGGQPYCNVCFRPIGVHGDGAAVVIPAVVVPAPVAPTPPPPPPPPPPPEPEPPAPLFVITNGIMVISAPQSRQPAPPSSLQQTAPLPAVYRPQDFPSASTLYSTAPPAPRAAVVGTVRVPVFADAIPGKIVAGDEGDVPDCVHEGYSFVLLTFTVVFSAFFVIFLVAALITGRSDGGDSEASVAASNPLVLVMAGWWLLCSAFYAYDCKRFDCRIYRGVRIESEEWRLLTALFTSSKATILWDVIVRDDAEVEVSERTPISFCLMGVCWSCFCTPPRWAVVVLKQRRSQQSQRPKPGESGAYSSDEVAPPATVLLARCLPGLADVDLRTWTNYIEAVTRSAAVRGAIRREAFLDSASDL